MSVRPVIFLHIPKTGGTSINKLLEELYASESRYSIGGTDPLERLRELEELPATNKDQIRLLHGHLIKDGDKILGKECIYFSFFRDPVERALSDFFYIQRAEHNRFHHEAKHLRPRDIPDFLLEKKWNDLQTRYLSSTPEEIRYDELRPDPEEVRKERFPIAMDLLKKKIDHPLIQEQFHRSLVYLQKVLEWDRLPGPFVKNRRSSKQSRRRIDPEVIERIESIHSCDRALYQEVTRIFEKNLEAVWDEGSEELLKRMQDRRGDRNLSFFKRVKKLFGRWD